eukprot:3380239-Ditylum_brightwellii.AAC.1
MMEHFNPHSDEGCLVLAMAMVEIAAIALGLKPLAQACYTLEGDSCLILRAWSVFNQMEESINMGFNTPGLEAAVDEALPMIVVVSNAYTSKSKTAKDVMDKSSEKCAKLEDELKELEASNQSITTSTTSCGWTSRKAATDGDALELITTRIVNKKIEVRDAKNFLKDAKVVAKEFREKYNDWQGKLPHHTCESLIDHG